MTVKDHMSKFLKIDENISIQEAAIKIDSQNAGSALITREDKAIGIVTEKDFLRKVVAKGKNASQTKIREIMSSPIITISADEKIKDASRMMSEKNIRRLGVVDDKGNIIGKITTHGISKSLGFNRFKKRIIEHPRNYYADNVK